MKESSESQKTEKTRSKKILDMIACKPVLEEIYEEILITLDEQWERRMDLKLKLENIVHEVVRMHDDESQVKRVGIVLKQFIDTESVLKDKLFLESEEIEHLIYST